MFGLNGLKDAVVCICFKQVFKLTVFLGEVHVCVCKWSGWEEESGEREGCVCVYVMEVTDRSRLNDMNYFHKSS